MLGFGTAWGLRGAVSAGHLELKGSSCPPVLPVLPPACCWLGWAQMEPEALPARLESPALLLQGAAASPGALWHHLPPCRWGSSVGGTGGPAQGSSQHSPVCSMQAATGCRSLHKAEMGSQALCRARRRKTQQRLVHIAQMWKTRASWTH